MELQVYTREIVQLIFAQFLSVYFLKNSGNADFEEAFGTVLQKVTAYMFAKFLVQPTVNAVKMDVFNACIAIEKGEDFWIDGKLPVSSDNFYSSVKLSRAMLLLHAYLNLEQVEHIPYDFHIEHILPRKWQNTSYNGWTYEQAQEWLDSFGNRVIFEKKLNIQAGNGYFGRKKQKYNESVIADVLALASFPRNDFNVADIEKREDEFIQRIMDFFELQGVC